MAAAHNDAAINDVNLRIFGPPEAGLEAGQWYSAGTTITQETLYDNPRKGGQNLLCCAGSAGQAGGA